MLGDNFFTTFFTCLGNKLSGASSPLYGSIINIIFIMHESQEVTSGVLKKVMKNYLPNLVVIIYQSGNCLMPPG